MLDFIRKGASSWMIKFLLGAIVIVFIFWGVGSFRSQRMDVIAKVNGEKIMTETFQREYNQTLEQYSKMFGGSIPESMLKQLNLKQQVLDSLINKTLIRQQAAKMGIRVSKQEVQQAILGIPAFKVNGVFDKRAYEAALRNARLTPAGFEAQVRESLLMEEIRALLGAGITVPETEAKEHYLYENQEINISYVKVDSSDCESEVQYSDEELKEWFETHREEYRTEPKIKLTYLLFDIKSAERDANVTEAEIEAWYEAHQQDYHKKEQRKARHILIKVPQDASEQEVEAKKKKIEEIRARIEKGADFAEVAKEVSEDPGSGKNGGELGFFTKNAMVKPFADVAFSMKKGELSQPVRTRFGWHIILLEDIKPEHTQPLDEVREEIRKRLATQKARKEVWDRANAAYDEIIQLGSLEDFAKTSGITLKSTPLFSKKSAPPMLGKNPELLNSIFALSKGELTSLLDVPDGVLIAEVTEKEAPHIPEFETVKERVKEAYIREKAKELCKQKAAAMLEEAKKNGLSSICAGGNCTIEETGFFKRTDPAANGKLPGPVARASLSLYSGKIFPDEVLESGNSFYVIAFKQAKEADLKGFDAEKKKISDTLLKEKEKSIFQNWLKHAREKAEIQISASFNQGD